jgi:hypothetical protein
VSTRVYVPSTLTALRVILVSGGLGPAPVLGRAVTDELRAAFADVGEDELEYLALTAAAQDSLGLLAAAEPPRRAVVVAEADTVTALDGDPGLVRVEEVLALRDLVAVYVDSEDAGADVAAARDAWPAARDGDETVAATVERCLDHELGWFATQEIGELVVEP